MSTNGQQYAGLAFDSYRTPNMADPKQREVEVEGVTYKILEHMDQPSGYQGTIYQRVDTGDIVVAHRGTELNNGVKAIVQDVVLADAGMVTQRTNLQTADAVELTRRALDYAKKSGPDYGNQTPEVTVTGHSLGGVLAQITAHHFDLRGETFNSYGAVSLGYRIPEGGDKVLNHVMAGDTVSAASRHYGQVRAYATVEEVRRLQDHGYENNRNPLDLRSPVQAALGSLGSHGMHHFLDVDDKERPDISVLGDPRARQLAAQYAPMFDKYRDDVAVVRGGITWGSRSGIGLIQDGIDQLRGPLPAGEPARREEQRNAPRHRPTPAERPVSSGLFDADGPLSLPEYGTPQRGPRAPLRQDHGEPAASPSSWRFGTLQADDPPMSDVARYTARIDRMLASAQSGDWQAFRHNTQALANSDAARAMREKAVETVDRQEQWAAQQAEQQRVQQEQQQSHSRGFSR